MDWGKGELKRLKPVVPKNQGGGDEGKAFGSLCCFCQKLYHYKVVKGLIYKGICQSEILKTLVQSLQIG